MFLKTLQMEWACEFLYEEKTEKEHLDLYLYKGLMLLNLACDVRLVTFTPWILYKASIDNEFVEYSDFILNEVLQRQKHVSLFFFF